MKQRLSQDDGVAMVSVVLVGMLAAMAIAILALRSTRNYDETLAERQQTEAIFVAESGLNKAVFQLNNDSDYYTTPASYGYPNPFANEQAERAWVLATVTNRGLPAISSGNGEYVIVKPEGQTVTYAAGFVPSLTEARAIRVVKLEYGVTAGPALGLSEALLTGGNLVIPGSPEFYGSSGSLHTNGDISGKGTADGYISSAGSFSGTYITGDPANSGSTGEVKSVPLTEPITLHYLSQYDMCPDGFVYAGPAYSDPAKRGVAGTPCSGTQLGDASGGYRGWKFGGLDGGGAGKWSYGTADKYDGVYFFHEGSVKISQSPGKNTTPWEATLLVNPVGGVACPNNQGGDINISGSPYMIPYSDAAPWLMVSGRDMKLPGSADSYGRAGNPGLVTAVEQAEITGSPNIFGAFILSGECDTPGSMLPYSQQKISGSPTFTFNGEFGYPGASSSSGTTDYRWSEL